MWVYEYLKVFEKLFELLLSKQTISPNDVPYDKGRKVGMSRKCFHPRNSKIHSSTAEEFVKKNTASFSSKLLLDAYHFQCLRAGELLLTGRGICQLKY